MRDLVLSAVCSDYRAIESYRYEPGPELRCPLVAMTADAVTGHAGR